MQSTESLRDCHLAEITDIQLTEIWCGALYILLKKKKKNE